MNLPHFISHHQESASNDAQQFPSAISHESAPCSIDPSLSIEIKAQESASPSKKKRSHQEMNDSGSDATLHPNKRRRLIIRPVPSQETCPLYT